MNAPLSPIYLSYKVLSVEVDVNEATITLSNGSDEIECYAEVKVVECQCSSSTWNPQDSVDYEIEAPQLTSFLAKNSDDEAFLLSQAQAKKIDEIMLIQADKAYLQVSEELAREAYYEAIYERKCGYDYY